MVKQIVEARDRAGRQHRRATLGTLQSLVIRPATRQRYERAFVHFLRYLKQQHLDLAPTRQELDHQVCDYLEHLWQDGESLALAGDTLSGLQHYQPSCKRHLQGGWRLLKAWQLRELPARAPPLTIPTLHTLLGALHGRSATVALGVYLAFRCLLRTGELLSLHAKDIIVPPHAVSGVLYLGLTKTGQRNPHAGTVTFTDRTLAARLRAWKHTVAPDTPLIHWSAAQFRAQFKASLQEASLASFDFKPYSLRRGGATDLWLTSRNYSLVSHTGRWSSERTLRVYIQDSIALLTDLHFRPTRHQQHLQSIWTTHHRVEPASSRTNRGRGRGGRIAS